MKKHNLLRLWNTFARKLAVLCAFLLSNLYILNAQTVYEHYVDGQIYFKLKNDVQLDVPHYRGSG
jgi:hypothetical protein